MLDCQPRAGSWQRAPSEVLSGVVLPSFAG
jgi:hypothetical protein